MAYMTTPTLWIYTLAEVSSSDGYQAKLTLIDTCEKYSSLLWDIAYYTVGSFEVYLPANAENFEKFRAGYVIAREDDTENYGIIEQIAIEADTENGDYMTVSGRFLPCLLARRIIADTAYSTAIDYSGVTYGQFAQYVLAVNGAEYDASSDLLHGKAQDTDRVIPGMHIDSDYSDAWGRAIQEDNSSDTMQVSYDNLMDWIYTICETVGGTISIDASDMVDASGIMTLSLTEGNDLSNTVIFSDTLHNLNSMDYTENFSDIVNVVKSTMSYNDNEYAVSLPTSNAPARFDRYEAHVAVENFEPESSPYEKWAYAAALDTFLKNVSYGTTASEAEIIAANSQYIYGTDYKVGDLVSIQYDRLGLSITKARLTDMIESFDQTGRTLTPTFEFDTE